MVKIEDVLKYTNDKDLQVVFQKKVAEEGAREDVKSIKELIKDKRIIDVDVILLIEKLPENLKSQKEELLKIFQEYLEQEDEIQNYYEEKYFKLGVMEALTIIINYFKNIESKTKQEERVINEIGELVIPIEFREALDLKFEDRAILTLDPESKEIRLRKKIN